MKKMLLLAMVLFLLCVAMITPNLSKLAIDADDPHSPIKLAIDADDPHAPIKI